MFLYHRTPPHMEGTELIPLNEQRELYPKLYEESVSKYAGRMEVMKIIIPSFECLWNDVLFLSPVHPQVINEVRRRYEVPTPERRWFEIDSNLLDQNKLLLFRHRPEWLIQKEMEKGEYEPFAKLSEEEKVSLSQLQEPGEWSIRRWREEALYFGYVPHILYRGRIETIGLPTAISTEVL